MADMILINAVERLTKPTLTRLRRRFGFAITGFIDDLDCYCWKHQAFAHHEIPDLAYQFGVSEVSFREMLTAAVDAFFFTQTTTDSLTWYSSPRVTDQRDGLAKRTRGLKQKTVTDTVTVSLRSPLQDKIRQDQIGSDQGECDGDSSESDTSKLHPSPDAPKHLKRKDAELHRYPDDDSLVWITDREKLVLEAKFGERRANFLSNSLNDWWSDKKKDYKKYSDHYRCILNRDTYLNSSGKKWFEHPDTGANYYPVRDVERWEALG